MKNHIVKNKFNSNNSDSLLDIINNFNYILNKFSSNNNINNKIECHLKDVLFSHISSDMNNKDYYEVKSIANGCIYGYVAFSLKECKQLKKEKKDVILVARNDKLYSINELKLFDGLILLDGTFNSHVAIVARSRNIPSVSISNESLKKDIQKQLAKNVGRIKCCIDGTYGIITFQEVNIYQPKQQIFNELKLWCQKAERVLLEYGSNPIKIMANADTPIEVSRALDYGASGIGGCRIEHMFLTRKRLKIMQELLLFPSEKKEQNLYEQQKEIIRKDVKKMLQIVSPMPFSIRLMDALPSEFLPIDGEEIKFLLNERNMSIENYNKLSEDILKSDGMLGIRGCRYGLVNRDIYISQIEGILRAAYDIMDEGKNIDISIVIPFIRETEELQIVINYINEVKDKLYSEYGEEIKVTIGTMIEIPRAMFIADKLAKICNLFIFGTNDLTQFLHALSRNSENMLYHKCLQSRNPFYSIDVEGVGEFIMHALKKGKIYNNELVAGICGEHVNDTDSLKFFKRTNVDFLSCISGNVLIIRVISLYQSIMDLLIENRIDLEKSI